MGLSRGFGRGSSGDRCPRGRRLPGSCGDPIRPTAVSAGAVAPCAGAAAPGAGRSRSARTERFAERGFRMEELDKNATPAGGAELVVVANRLPVSLERD